MDILQLCTNSSIYSSYPLHGKIKGVKRKYINVILIIEIWSNHQEIKQKYVLILDLTTKNGYQITNDNDCHIEIDMFITGKFRFSLSVCIDYAMQAIET